MARDTPHPHPLSSSYTPSSLLWGRRWSWSWHCCTTGNTLQPRCRAPWCSNQCWWWLCGAHRHPAWSHSGRAWRWWFPHHLSQAQPVASAAAVAREGQHSTATVSQQASWVDTAVAVVPGCSHSGEAEFCVCSQCGYGDELDFSTGVASKCKQAISNNLATHAAEPPSAPATLPSVMSSKSFRLKTNPR